MLYQTLQFVKIKDQELLKNQEAKGLLGSTLGKIPILGVLLYSYN